jgi:hypothetical protein
MTTINLLISAIIAALIMALIASKTRIALWCSLRYGMFCSPMEVDPWSVRPGMRTKITSYIDSSDIPGNWGGHIYIGCNEGGDYYAICESRRNASPYDCHALYVNGKKVGLHRAVPILPGSKLVLRTLSRDGDLRMVYIPGLCNRPEHEVPCFKVETP